MKEILLRFVIGGVVVSSFAVIGDIFKPKSFAGLFGAAPSVALATLALTVAKNGRVYSAIEARSMIAGAIAFFVYASLVSAVAMRRNWRALPLTSSLIVLWIGLVFCFWAAFLQ